MCKVNVQLPKLIARVEQNYKFVDFVLYESDLKFISNFLSENPRCVWFLLIEKNMYFSNLAEYDNWLKNKD